MLLSFFFVWSVVVGGLTSLGELADDADEGAVFVAQALVLGLELFQHLQRYKKKIESIVDLQFIKNGTKVAKIVAITQEDQNFSKTSQHHTTRRAEQKAIKNEGVHAGQVTGQ